MKTKTFIFVLLTILCSLYTGYNTWTLYDGYRKQVSVWNEEAKDAFEEAAAILVNQYSALAGSTKVESSPAPGSNTEDEDAGLMLPIEELELSARTANALLNNDIRTIRDLVTLSETDLKDLKGFGQKALDEVKEKLTELNI